jgi:hypothetical protein
LNPNKDPALGWVFEFKAFLSTYNDA